MNHGIVYSMSAEKQKFAAGETLFAEGDRADCLYIIQRGSVSLRRRRGAEQVELGRAKQGEVIGEMSFFDSKNRSASAVALVTTDTLVISYSSLEKIYESTPEYFKTIIMSVTDRLREADMKITRLETKTLNESEGGEKRVDEEDNMEAIVAVSHTIQNPGDGSSSGENSGES